MNDFPEQATLIIVDVQQGFSNHNRYNPNAEANVGRLLAHWRATNRPLYHIQHHSTEPDSPLRPDQPGVNFQPIAEPQPGEPVIIKHVNSAFIGTNLEQRLRDAEIDTLVICGLTTEHCVSTTVRMAGNLGFRVFLAGDATAAFAKTSHDGTHIPAQQVYQTALANLHNEFATVLNTTDLLQWAATSE
jgi:nicotinamidase-related amidase